MSTGLERFVKTIWLTDEPINRADYIEYFRNWWSFNVYYKQVLEIQITALLNYDIVIWIMILYGNCQNWSDTRCRYLHCLNVVSKIAISDICIKFTKKRVNAVSLALDLPLVYWLCIIHSFARSGRYTDVRRRKNKCIKSEYTIFVTTTSYVCLYIRKIFTFF